MLTRGIILIASGSPFYGRMVYNLAVSIRAVEDMPITVLHNGAALSHLSAAQREVFNEIETPERAFAAKLSLIDYSPYSETLYLDADMIWLPTKKPSELFDELSGNVFTCITEGYYDYDNTTNHGNDMYHFWADPIECAEKWGLSGKLYQCRSEVMYFTKEALPIFDLAKEVYRSPKVKVKSFAGHTPDELAINIAMAKLGIEPHKYQWKPAYWHRLHGEGKTLPEIMYNYYLLSVGGNYASRIMKTCYNNVCMAAYKKLGLRFLFPLDSKKSVMPERLKM